MTKIRVNKIDAARRQLAAAIRMTFDEEDPIAIHTIVAASHRIIRDICAARGDIESYLKFTDLIAEGHEKEFWQFWNTSANFLKHADKDADEIHVLDQEVSDFLIVITSKWFKDLGNNLSQEMRVFAGWYTILHPNLLKPAALVNHGISEQYSALSNQMNKLSRADKLKVGMLMLRQSK